MIAKLSFLLKLAVMLFFFTCCHRASFTLDERALGETVIVLPEESNSVCRFAADEFNRHLRLMYGKELPVVEGVVDGKYKQEVFIGIRPTTFDRGLRAEEAVYLTEGPKLFMFGDDLIQVKASREDPGEFNDIILSEVLQMQYNRTGTLFAVYKFLEDELGITWLKPGDEGIFFQEKPSIVLGSKEIAWTPEFVQRNIRTGSCWSGLSGYAPPEFAMSEQECKQKNADQLIWLRRMRFGYSEYYRFGHAFTQYWEKYKDTHPDIFALTARGTRRPMKRPERIKMCPSNPDLVGIAVSEWQANLARAPHQNSGSISGCENDTDGSGSDEWCHCDKCRALDAHLDSEELEDHLTDRYVHFWNGLVKEARNVKSDIMVSGYAYQEMLLPPRNIELDEGLLIEFIPRMAGDFSKTQELFTRWREKGMKTMFFRPNDLNWELGIAMGQEERVFQHLQLAIKNGARGTDFDSMLGFWEGISDMTYFILARAHLNPEASFEELENEFLRVFGNASEDIRAYYRHWREIFNNELIPADLELSDGVSPVYFEWHRMGKLTQRIDEFYSISDFDITDSYLESALSKEISNASHRYIERMQIANQHSRLTFLSLLAGIRGNKDALIENARALINYRIANINKVDIAWDILFWSQHYHLYDQIGTRYLDYMSNRED